jgi:predicted nucleic acid-binding protein
MAHAAIAKLMAANEPLYAAVQNVAEFWNAATRPIAHNGLGYSTREAAQEVAEFEQFIRILNDPPDTYRRWKTLAIANRVIGVQSHDTRLLALMQAHDVRSILTFDDDFTRFAEITVVHPADVAPARPTA